MYKGVLVPILNIKNSAISAIGDKKVEEVTPIVAQHADKIVAFAAIPPPLEAFVAMFQQPPLEAVVAMSLQPRQNALESFS